MAVLQENLQIDQYLKTLQEHKDDWVKETIPVKIRMLKEVLINLKKYSQNLANLTYTYQKIDPNTPYAGEIWGGGIWAIGATVQGYIGTLKCIEKGKDPKFKNIEVRKNGQLKIKVFPNNLTEKSLLHGVEEEIWMKEEVGNKNLSRYIAPFYKKKDKKGKVALVLGAGNVISIPVLDALYKLIADGEVVILKMNPIFDYAGPIVEKVLEPFIRRGFLRIAYGDKELGHYLVHNPSIDSIHMTGSLKTYNNILNGFPSKEVDQNNILTKKTFTSELGGVAPIIVLPGKWSKADIRYQAENVVTMKMYNSGFICVSAQVLILPEKWELKEDFLQAIRDVLKSLPPRDAYYPGVQERYKLAVANHARVETFNGQVPATLITDLDIDNDKEYLFNEEIFGPVLGQVNIPGESPESYLENVVAFCNKKLLGTLGASIIVHPDTLAEIKNEFEEALSKLKYGSIGVNLWNAMAFLLPYTAWGAYPLDPLSKVESGSGIVHNAFLLTKTEKTIARGPFYKFPRSFMKGKFTMLPKPAWFVTNKKAVQVNKKIAYYTIDKKFKHLPSLYLAALNG